MLLLWNAKSWMVHGEESAEVGKLFSQLTRLRSDHIKNHQYVLNIRKFWGAGYLHDHKLSNCLLVTWMKKIQWSNQAVYWMWSKLLSLTKNRWTLCAFRCILKNTKNWVCNMPANSTWSNHSEEENQTR